MRARNIFQTGSSCQSREPRIRRCFLERCLGFVGVEVRRKEAFVSWSKRSLQKTCCHWVITSASRAEPQGLVCPGSRPGAGPSWWLPGVGDCPQGQHQKCPVTSLHSSGYHRDSISISCFPWKHAERGSVGSTWDRDQDRFGAVSAHHRRPCGARVLPDGGRVTG